MSQMSTEENAALRDLRLLLISYNLSEKLYIYERKGPLGPPWAPQGSRGGGRPGGGGGRISYTLDRRKVGGYASSAQRCASKPIDSLGKSAPWNILK